MSLVLAKFWLLFFFKRLPSYSHMPHVMLFLALCMYIAVAGAVLQTPPSLIKSVRDPIPQYPQNIGTPKPLKIGTGIVRQCSPRSVCQVSHIMCHVSHVICHVSSVTCHTFEFDFYYNLLQLVGGGSVLNGAYPV